MLTGCREELTEDQITIDKWEEYLDNLFEWIQEKYELFEEQKISEEEYNEHLSYYMKEKDRIESIIDNLLVVSERDEEVEKGNEAVLSQNRFENFFGVKLEDELQKIDEEEETNEIKTSNKAKKDVTDKIEKVWNDVEKSANSDFHVPDMFEGTKSDIQEIKILLVGDSAVGRTSLRRAWMGKHFVESHLTTIGASIEKKIIEMDGENYQITITDLGGQDFYSGLRRNFYRNIDGAILVFDLTKPKSFRRLDYWIKEMYREIKQLVPFILVGNKKDSRQRKIPEKYGIRASAQFSRTTLPKFRVRYIETSAKTGENVEMVFETICREVKEHKNP